MMQPAHKKMKINEQKFNHTFDNFLTILFFSLQISFFIAYQKTDNQFCDN